MKLDMDCVRDILMECEGLPLGCHTPYSFQTSIARHGEDEVCYTLAKLGEGNYINASISRLPGGQYDFYGIYDMTFAGHQFLENIMDDKVWHKAKGVLKKAGSSSFNVFMCPPQYLKFLLLR